MIYARNVTSQSIDVQVVDDSGLPVTGLVAATFPALNWSLAGANNDAAFPALSDLATLSTAWVAGGLKERGGGVYRLDLPNQIFGSAGEVKVRGEAANKRVLAPWLDVAVPVASVTGSVDSVTNPVAVSSLGASVITAVSIASNALNDKGDWATPSMLPGNFLGLLIDGFGRVTVGTNVDKAGYGLDSSEYLSIANAIWTDTEPTDFTTAGSPGKVLVAQLGGTFTSASSSIFTVGALANAPGGSGSSTDYLTNTVASYASPQLGWLIGTYVNAPLSAIKAKTDTLGTGLVNVISPVGKGGLLSLVRGDDYRATDGRSLDFPQGTANWPDLTGASVTLAIGHAAPVTVTGSIPAPTGSSKLVRFEPTSAQTASLPEAVDGYTVLAVLANGDHVTLALGQAVVYGSTN